MAGASHTADSKRPPTTDSATRCMQATVVGRRLLGKHLAFATLELQNAGPTPELLKVRFRRAAAEGDSTVLVWDDSSSASFPSRRSLLQLGTHCTVCCTQPVDQVSEVIRWTITSKVGQGEGTGWAPAGAGGAFSVPERLRVRSAAYHDAVAAVTAATGAGKPPCREWLKTGQCEAMLRGECEAFSHEFASEEDKARAVRRRAARKQSFGKKIRSFGDGSGPEEEQCCNDDGHVRETKLQKTQRTSQFVEFLLEIYGKQALNQGCGVLDVAGGRGNISFQLQCEHDIQSTLIDPGVRAHLLNPKQRKQLKKSGKVVFRHIAACLDDDFAADPDRARYLQEASLLIGMHPDEATEQIVLHALAHGKKFAVVPCCVFACLWPDRKLKDGTLVRHVDEFCLYLKEKDPRIREKWLPFVGRNRVLYIP